MFNFSSLLSGVNATLDTVTGFARRAVAREQFDAQSRAVFDATVLQPAPLATSTTIPQGPVIIDADGENPEIAQAIRTLGLNQEQLTLRLDNIGTARATNTDRASVARLTGEAQRGEAEKRALLLLAALALLMTLNR